MKHRKLKTTPETSKRMSNVKLKHNKAETTLAKALWHKGYRYRLNYKKLPGSPDIALTKYKIAIFVDGEFWHGKDFEKRKNKLKSNKDYWIEKIQENIDRDQKNDILLHQMGWIPLHFWSKEAVKNIDYCVCEIKEYVDAQILGMDIEKE
ncbi:very short patch repair endonuclease [Faecalicoccus acidiformans]|uniref:very short patch repair endonuclease n=1 Tax=Faecalicoccus acidiformans TaxID=915173 RepID=UPI0025A3FB69|nr:very short patch repair endonuclease [Faecalicoccus acidiformans]MDM8202788.1 very short patch repair endonuclease [Faecalicoccus acidiformans]